MTDVSAIAARMKLATLQTGAWRATRQHRPETNEVNARHGVNVAKVLVRITDHAALSDLTKLHAAAYIEHKRITLPTVQDGMRLLPVGRELEHSSIMGKFADQHSQLVKTFLADYEDEAAQAPIRLNGLYEASMWPPLGVVESRFKFGTRYLATPTDGAWGDWLAESKNAADNELRERLEEALKRVRERCNSDGKLFASVFDSIRELTELVPEFDVEGQLAPVVQAMAPLASLHADKLRDDEDGRKDAARKADSILSILGGIK